MIKEVFAKYIGQVLITLTVLGIAYFAYSAYRDSLEERKFAELIGTKEKYEQLTAHTAKLESNYQAQKTLHEKAKKDWAEVARKKDERIKVLSDATYLLGRHVEKQNGPDYYFETPKKTRNYILNELRIQGENSPAIGYIMIKSDGRTYKRNYKFTIEVQNLQTIDEETGRVKVYAKAFLVAQESSPLKKRVPGYQDWHGKKYPLSITGGVAYIDPTQKSERKKFQLWAPHVNGGFNLGVDKNGTFLRPGISFSTSGYGKSRNDLDWKLFQLGIYTDTEFKKQGVYITPFTYRAFPAILTNTYFGPGIGWTEDGPSYFLNTNVSF